MPISSAPMVKIQLQSESQTTFRAGGSPTISPGLQSAVPMVLNGVSLTGRTEKVFFFSRLPGGTRWERIHQHYSFQSGDKPESSDRLSSFTSSGSGGREHDDYRECPETRRLGSSLERNYAIMDLAAAHVGWDTRNLCYEFTHGFPDVAKPGMLRSFETWEERSDLTFTCSWRPPGEADILIGMYPGAHGAFFPPDGRMYFNSEYKWWYDLVPPPSGVFFYDFQSAATREIGHVLGLDHVRHRKAVMFRSLRSCELRRGLSDADVAALNLLCHFD